MSVTYMLLTVYVRAAAGADILAWAAWAWGYVSTVVEIVVGLLIFMRLWRVQGVRKFLAVITGVTELQKGNIGLLEEKVKLLEGQKKLTEEQRDEFERQLKESERLRAEDAQGWAEAMATVQREADGRRIINDQDTQIIAIYEHLHGVPDEVAELIERRRAEAVARARERTRLQGDGRQSSDAIARPREWGVGGD